MSKKRRTWSAQDKSEIVLEILKEDQTLAEISKKYEIAQPVLSRWKADFINNMAAAFDKNVYSDQRTPFARPFSSSFTEG